MTVDVGPWSLRLIVSVGHHNVQGISPSRRVRHGGVSHPFAVRDFPPQDGDLATSKSSLVWAEILPRCGNHNRTLSSPVRLCVPCAANQQNRALGSGGDGEARLPMAQRPWANSTPMDNWPRGIPP